jgi:hypothetical protein
MFSMVLVMPSIVFTVGGRLASGRRVAIADFADVVFGFAFALVAFFAGAFFFCVFLVVAGFFVVAFFASGFFFAVAMIFLLLPLLRLIYF